MDLITTHTLPVLADGGALEMAVIQAAIGAVISIGVSLVSAALFKPKQASDVTNFPANQITRGGYLPVVIGRRVVGCNIGFVGDRKSYAAPHSGGSEINAQPSSGNIFLEAGWHQLCHGPTRQTLRVWTGSNRYIVRQGGFFHRVGWSQRNVAEQHTDRGRPLLDLLWA